MYVFLYICLYLYCAFVIDTVYTKRDFMRRYFIAILVCIYYVCFFKYVYLWCFMPRHLSEMMKINITNQSNFIAHFSRHVATCPFLLGSKLYHVSKRGPGKQWENMKYVRNTNDTGHSLLYFTSKSGVSRVIQCLSQSVWLCLIE